MMAKSTKGSTYLSSNYNLSSTYLSSNYLSSTYLSSSYKLMQLLLKDGPLAPR